MDYHDIRLILDLPAAKLLRSPQAAMICAFLFQTYKRKNRTGIPEGELAELLDVFLNERRESEPDSFPQSAADYLNIWCDNQHGFLRKYYAEEGKEPFFELTGGTEKAILWLESLHSTGFVGTESRLESIFKGLDEIVEFSTANPEERVQRLLARVREMEEEIAKIRSGGELDVFTPVQINERFERLLITARELLSDFRQVEENFKAIAQDIAERHALPGVTKGAILAHLLDSFDALCASPQGQSFYGFLELLLSADRKDSYQSALSEVYKIDSLDPKLKEDNLLRQLFSRLGREGEKVAGSNQRLATNLRRVLDTTHINEHRRVLELIREVQAAALIVKDAPPDQEALVDVEHSYDFTPVFGRDMWCPADVPPMNLAAVEDNDQLTEEDLLRFQNLPYVRLDDLRTNVDQCLRDAYTITLPQLLDRFPPQYGMVEVLGYILIAVESNGHDLVHEEQSQEIELPDGSKWQVPSILFCRKL